MNIVNTEEELNAATTTTAWRRPDGFMVIHRPGSMPLTIPPTLAHVQLAVERAHERHQREKRLKRDEAPAITVEAVPEPRPSPARKARKKILEKKT